MDLNQKRIGVKIPFTLLWNGLTMLLLVHIQSLQSSGCLFILTKPHCVLCMYHQKEAGFLSLANTANLLDPVKSPSCQKLHLQAKAPSILDCTDSLLWAGQRFLPVNISVTLVRRWHHHGKNNHHIRESHIPHTSHPLPSRNLFPCVAKLVHFHAVSVVSASLTLFLSLSSFANSLATVVSRLCRS